MHLKRHPAPDTWTIERKSITWAPAHRPGPHSGETSVPLVVALRDMLGVADNTREARSLATNGKVKVDGVVRRDHKFPVGLFDVLTVGDADYRMGLDLKNRFFLREADRPGVKLAKVVDATTQPGGTRQAQLSDGTNVESDAPTGSTLVLEVPEKEVAETVPMEPGNLAFITGGKHAGQMAVIEEYVVGPGSNPNQVTLERDGEEFATVEKYVFVVGEDEPEVEI